MLKGLLVGFAITFGLSIVPIIHFITIWPAPFIGGFVAGARAEANVGKAFGLGAALGLLMAAPAIGIVWTINLFFSFVDGAGLILGVAGVIAAYIALLGSLGAMIGGQMALRQHQP